jgi:hypothetical protein
VINSEIDLGLGYSGKVIPITLLDDFYAQYYGLNMNCPPQVHVNEFVSQLAPLFRENLETSGDGA